MDMEQTKLDQALTQPDPLLIDSLQRDDRQRRVVLMMGISILVVAAGAIGFVVGRTTALRKPPASAVQTTGQAPSLDPQTASKVASALEQFRQTMVAYRLGFDAVFPKVLPAGYDPVRLGDYPSKESWPKVLGYVQRQPGAYRAALGTADYKPSGTPDESLALAFTTPLSRAILVEGYGTVICLEGIASGGIITHGSYGSVISKGNAAGKLVFESYGTLLVDGNFSGQLTANSYFAAAITGKVSGRIVLSSYAMVYILGGFDGQAELKSSTLLLAGRVTRQQLQRIAGSGRVFVDESDLPAGTHQFGAITVIVGSGIKSR